MFYFLYFTHNSESLIHNIFSDLKFTIEENSHTTEVVY